MAFGGRKGPLRPCQSLRNSALSFPPHTRPHITAIIFMTNEDHFLQNPHTRAALLLPRQLFMDQTFPSMRAEHDASSGQRRICEATPELDITQ